MNNVNIVVLHTVRILGLISVFEVGVWKELSELLFSLSFVLVDWLLFHKNQDGLIHCELKIKKLQARYSLKLH